MSDGHPIDDSLNEIEKILKLLKKLQDQKLNVTDFDDINKQIADVAEEVDRFAEETDAILKESGLSDARLKEALEVIPKDLSPEDQEALKKAQKLKTEVLRLKEEMTGTEEFIKQPKKEEKKKDKMLSKEEHMKKYKRLGSKKKWKPL